MRFRTLWCFLFAALVCQSPVSAADCLEILQFQPTAGKVLLHVTPLAVRLELKDTKLLLIARAPDWQVYVCNPVSKKMAPKSFDAWCKTGIENLFFVARDKQPSGKCLKRSATVVDGIKAIRVLFSSKREQGSSSGRIAWSINLSDAAVTDIYEFSDDKRIDPHAGKIVSVIYALNFESRLPLSSAFRLVQGGRGGQGLQLLSIKTVSEKVGEFEVPKYPLVPMREVMQSTFDFFN
jgi:hypothetical protein